MVVLDSSAVIPLLKIGKLELIKKNFDSILVPDVVWKEVVEEGKRIGASVAAFEKGKNNWFKVLPSPDKKECMELAKEEYLEEADAEVLLLAKQKKDILLTNDAALYACCISHAVDAWWLTTLLLASVKRKIISRDEAEMILFELVNSAKMHLSTEILTELLMIIKNI